MKVFVSQQWDILVDVLERRGIVPWHGHTLVFPSEQIKLHCYMRWLEHRTVLTGIQATTLPHLLHTLFPLLPSSAELTLRLESLLSMPHPAIAPYLEQGDHPRKLALAQELSRIFLRYLELPRDRVMAWLQDKGWQQHLWKELFGMGLPTDTLKLLDGTWFFQSIQHVPEFAWAALNQMDSEWYFLTPSAMYTGDLRTRRERRYVLDRAGSHCQYDLGETFDHDPALLSSWGSFHRKCMHSFEQAPLLYLEGETPTRTDALHQLRKEWLSLELQTSPVDDSLQLHSAISQQHEIDIICRCIEDLEDTPRDVLVLAPDIRAYQTQIQWACAVRERSFDHVIQGVAPLNNSPFLQSVQQLLSLPQWEFSKQAFEKLLACPLFLSRWNLTFDEGVELGLWMDRFKMRYHLNEGPFSWKSAIGRALQGCVEAPSDSVPLLWSDTDLLNTWIDIADHLERCFEAVSSSHSGSYWRDWIDNLLETFFPPHEDRKHLDSLLRLLNHQGRGVLVPYATIQALIDDAMTSPTDTIGSRNLNAVRFASLSVGSLTPASTLFLIGMHEGNFPRASITSSLQELPCPDRREHDLSLLIDACLLAKRRCIITYCRVHPDDGRPMHPCPAVQELIADRGAIATTHHEWVDINYPQKQQLITLSPSRPLPQEIPLKLLQRLAQHPLRYFLKERGIVPKPSREESEFVPPPYDTTAPFPPGICGEMIQQEWARAKEEEQQALHALGVNPSSRFTLELSPYCTTRTQPSPHHIVVPAITLDGYTIRGRIEGMTPQGILEPLAATLETLLARWPMYCLTFLALGPQPVLSLAKKKAVEVPITDPAGALSRYLRYAEKSLQRPSPLLPAWGQAILKGDGPQDFIDDATLLWARDRHLIPPLDLWIQEWQGDLKEVFCELL